ncbi:MAG: phospho-sugar mutase [Ruminococcaceae bacterium]|nr:phospho-sugar mutase [Oscillospiraceae bacterium]
MSYLEQYKRWMTCGVLTEAELAELAAIENDPKEIESRFYAQLEFGTAGLRGTMGMGTNRMNVYVVKHSTQAFAEVILEEGPEAAEKGIAVAYDCRNGGTEFAREAACVMAANGIKVRLFESLRPTPELSFAVRHYGCIAGINVTASHNPKEYNGYKVYWSDGAQLPPKHASEIAEKMVKNDVFDSVKTMDYDEAIAKGLITIIGEETDEAFLANVMAQVNDPETIAKVADDFKMVFTPFHGTGHKLIPEALTRLGIKNLYCEPQQMVISGDFPTVASPNPENPEGFYLAVDLAKEKGADFIIGSDPDADRVGIMVKNDKGDYVVISGNQTGVLVLDYLIGAKKRAGTMPANPVALKTIVTTEMARKVAEVNGLQCYSTFTGFKFISEKKNALEASGEGNVIFSYEESYGYMFGDYVRDKDAVTAALIITEMAAWYYSQGKTLYDALMELYEKYGWYGERTMNLVMPGLDGLSRMKALMIGLRENSPAEIGTTKVVAVCDYLDGTRKTAEGTEKMELSGSNVLSFELEDGTTILVRPSGTEPKVKVYILAKGESKADCDAKVAMYAAWADGLK